MILRQQPSQAGFTLIELLVVIAIMGVLAALTATFMPGMLQRQTEAAGASQVQGILQVARYRAIRDRLPTGVRFYRDSSGSAVFTRAQYIQQPDDFTGGILVTLTGTTTANNTLRFSGVDLFGGFGSADPTLWPVQSGDSIEIQGSGLVAQITSIVQSSVTPPTFDVTLQTPLLEPITTPTASYRIIRRPRLLDSETMDLPLDVGIDQAASQPAFTGMTELDVLFAPSGPLQNITTDRLIFYVRDMNNSSITQGDPTLIVVYSRTGLVASYPIDRTSGNVYGKVK